METNEAEFRTATTGAGFVDWRNGRGFADFSNRDECERAAAALAAGGWSNVATTKIGGRGEPTEYRVGARAFSGGPVFA